MESKMNLFTKTAPWVVASLIAATSAFGQNKSPPPAQKTFEPGHELMSNQFMAAYNAPARIDVRGAWDFYAFGAFTYWQARQENMELAFVRDTTSTADFEGDFVNLDFDYKPGFKVGIGMNFDHDNWDTSLIYTWFRSKNTQHTSVDGLSSEIFPLIGHPEVTDHSTYTSAKEAWHLHMDLLDLELARSHYSGMSLTFRPFFGARAAWIRQREHAIYATPIAGVLENEEIVPDTTVNVVQKSYSWAVGPRAGLYSNWMLGQGFRLYGNGAGDILYTRYSELSERAEAVTAGVLGDNDHPRQKNNDSLRTHLELELGIAWASYFDNNNWHVDLAAGYTFQTFFNQNMFRHYVRNSGFGNAEAYSTCPNGDLFIHGLTATLRFDF
jgi:hypothetical protein